MDENEVIVAKYNLLIANLLSSNQKLKHRLGLDKRRNEYL